MAWSPGQRNRLNIVYRGMRLVSECQYLMLSLGSEGKMQALRTVEKPLLPCPFKMKEWMEEDRTGAIWRNKSRGLFAV